MIFQLSFASTFHVLSYLVPGLVTSLVWWFILRGRVSAAYLKGRADSAARSASMDYILGFRAGRKFQQSGLVGIE